MFGGGGTMMDIQVSHVSKSFDSKESHKRYYVHNSDR